MQAARRSYLYAMSGVALAVVAAGLGILLEVALAQSGLLERGPNAFSPPPRLVLMMP